MVRNLEGVPGNERAWKTAAHFGPCTARQFASYPVNECGGRYGVLPWKLRAARVRRRGKDEGIGGFAWGSVNRCRRFEEAEHAAPEEPLKRQAGTNETTP